MQQNIFFNEDGLWDDLNESDVEQCILKENEFLTQNPSVVRKVTTNDPPDAEEPSHANYWLDNNCNSFCQGFSKPASKILNKQASFEKSHVKGKGNTCASSFSSHNSKKQSFYRPLKIESSITSNSSYRPSDQTPFHNKDEKNETDITALQTQLSEILEKKIKLEEENLLKHGEVLNIKCELKRKDKLLEAERIDHCLALEAAEIRGKDKSSKLLKDAEIKINNLEQEVDRLQGNLIFKNREVDELLLRCQKFECQSSVTCPQDTFLAGDTSPKRRRLNLERSCTKDASNFANRFDFSKKKRSFKNALTQTESKTMVKRRKIIQVSSASGQFSRVQKVNQILLLQKMLCSVTALDIDPVKQKTYTQPTSQPTHSLMKSEALSVDLKSLHTLIDCLLQEICSLKNLPSDSRNKLHKKYNGVGSINSPLKFTADSCNDLIIQDCLQILSFSLLSFLKLNPDQTESVVMLESLSVLAQMCSDINSNICDTVILSFKECCKSTSDQVILKFLLALVSFSRFENFRIKLCFQNLDECLLKQICNLFQFQGSSLEPKELTDLMVTFVAGLLNDFDLLVANRDCQCCILLLDTYINHLFITAEVSSEDTCWHSVITGVKVLHLWQIKNQTLWEKAPLLHSYTALRTLVIQKSNYLKEKQILDKHAWEIIVDLYDMEEAALG